MAHVWEAWWGMTEAGCREEFGGQGKCLYLEMIVVWLYRCIK